MHPCQCAIIGSQQICAKGFCCLIGNKMRIPLNLASNFFICLKALLQKAFLHIAGYHTIFLA
jgi:hypothetical protein